MRLFRLFLAFVIAVALTVAVAVAANSQFVMAGLRGLGAEIGAGQALHVTLHDIVGMGPIYAMFIATALLLGFLIAGFLWPRLKVSRALGFAIGGGAAVALMLVIMREVLGVTMVAGARSPAGFAAQCVAGVLGGLVFALISRSQAGRATPI